MVYEEQTATREVVASHGFEDKTRPSCRRDPRFGDIWHRFRGTTRHSVSSTSQRRDSSRSSASNDPKYDEAASKGDEILKSGMLYCTKGARWYI